MDQYHCINLLVAAQFAAVTDDIDITSNLLWLDVGQLLCVLTQIHCFLDPYAGTDQRAIEDLTGLATITSTLAGSSCTSDAALADVDLVDVLSGCMENKADADQLAAGLLEMENELKALTDDETSFLQFPCES